MSDTSLHESAPDNNTHVEQPDMLRAALWYAKHGLAVFPLHTPLFDHPDGHTCTCEAYRHSDLCKARDAERKRKNQKPLYLEPGQFCDHPGKHPRGVKSWTQDSTTDPNMIRAWWRRYPTANIGIDCGKSGILMLDADKYKNDYQGDKFLTKLDEETVTVISGNLGSHLYYRMPEGKTWGNDTGTLPAGIDIRGHGGFVVAPPSLHASGRRYQFEHGYGPTEINIGNVSPALAAILDAAQSSKSTRYTSGSARWDGTPTTEPIDLAAFNVSDDILSLIAAPPAKGNRSEADMRVVVALCYAGATDDDILAVFQHNPIGTVGKLADRGLDYLERTVTAARAYVEAHPPPETLRQQLEPVRAWIRSSSCYETLRTAEIDKPIRRPAGYADMLEALVLLAADRGLTFTPGLRALSMAANVSPESARKQLSKLAEVGLIGLAATENGLTVDLLPLVDTVGPKVDTTPKGGKCEEVSTLGPTANFHQRLGHDAFLTLAYPHAIKRREGDTVLLKALGRDARRVFLALESGVGTSAEIHEMTGISPLTARRTLGHLVRLGLVDAAQDTVFTSKHYTLKMDAWQRLEELLPEMTTYMTGQRRMACGLIDRANFAQVQAVRAKDDKTKAKAEHRRDTCEALAAATVDAIMANGIKPPKVNMWQPTKHDEERGARLRRNVAAEAHVDQRETAAERYRARMFEPLRAELENPDTWEEFNTYMTITHGPGWWVRMSDTDVLGAYSNYKFVTSYPPGMAPAAPEPMPTQEALL